MVTQPGHRLIGAEPVVSWRKSGSTSKGNVSTQKSKQHQDYSPWKPYHSKSLKN